MHQGLSLELALNPAANLDGTGVMMSCGAILILRGKEDFTSSQSVACPMAEVNR